MRGRRWTAGEDNVGAAERTDLVQRFTVCAGVVCLAGLVGFGAVAEPFPEDPALLEAYLDGIVEPAMAMDKIPGVTVSVVKDGELFFSKGYGYADVEARIPVDPATTLFRIGSISKLFTWLMVMDLVGQGRLSLDTDVNEHLATFNVPDTFGEPVRIWHLLSHTPGFEDRVIGLFARDATAMQPLEQLLANDLPARIWPPGIVPSYSNHGTALAALVASNVSGVPWEAYTEDHVMRPIGMRYATALQPVPEALAEHMAKGYRYENGAFVDKGFEFVPMAPAGGVSASAEAMAHFMLMLINGGEWNGHRVIAEDTLATMKEQLFTLDPRVTGMAHGFIESRVGDVRLIGHGGDTFWFHSMLLLDEEHDIGLFVSTNSREGGRLPVVTGLAFFDHYFPPAEPAPIAMAEGAVERAEQLAGKYGVNRHDYTGPAKIGALMSVTNVVAADDGALVFPPVFGTVPVRWLEVEPGMYRNEFGDETVVFERHEATGAPFFTVPNFSVFVFERLEGMDIPAIAIGIVVACILVFIGAPILWLVRAITRIRRKNVTSRYVGMARLSKLVAAFMCLWILGALVLSGDMEDPLDIVYGLPASFVLMLQMNVVAGALAALVAVLALAAWVRGYWSFFGRLEYSVVAAAGLIYFYWVYYWNFTAL